MIRNKCVVIKTKIENENELNETKDYKVYQYLAIVHNNNNNP